MQVHTYIFTEFLLRQQSANSANEWKRFESLLKFLCVLLLFLYAIYLQLDVFFNEVQLYKILM